MPNFQLGKVYSVRSLSRPELIYIGSTTQSLAKRMGQHRKASNKCASREIIAIGDAYIELIENFPCANKEELSARENRHMRALENVVNRYSAQDDCPHGRRQSGCVECHGSGICEHNKIRAQCIECHGSGICEHDKHRSSCIEFHGVSICEHNRARAKCIECHGASVCEHDKLRAQCIECHGSGICVHNKRRLSCVECSPIRCEVCNTTHSRGHYRKHTKTDKHITNITPTE